MASVSLSQLAVAAVKKALRDERPDVRSAHLTEALACALGYQSHAALLAAMDQQKTGPTVQLLDDARFEARLQQFGYSPDPEFSFDLMEIPELISTVPLSAFDIEYRGLRSRAWRNVLICGINAGLQQKLFGLKPGDNRWPGWDPANEHNHPNGFLFDFVMPGNLPCRGYVYDIGHGELAFNIAVHPKGDAVRAGNAGFHAGEAFACGWLERKTGAWLQSANSLFNCRKQLLAPLASLDVMPMGYGDRGRVIM